MRPDELVDLALQRLVLGYLRAARHGELQERHPLAMLGVMLEQSLEGEDPLGDALRVVEAIDAEHDELFGLERGLRLVGAALLGHVVDAEREGADLHGPVAVLDEPVASCRSTMRSPSSRSTQSRKFAA